MKKRYWLTCLVMLSFLLAAVTNVSAAQDEVVLHLRLIRNFGYGGFGQIQGRFTLKVQEAPEGLEEVEFYVDGERVATITEAPFEFKFHTSEFADGLRVLSAIGVLADGSVVESNRISKEFLSSEQAWSETEGMLVPLLIIVGLLTLVGVAVPLIVSNQKDFALGKYGPAGGVVCPRCLLPFSRSIMSPNLVAGKLVRCPHCGKVSVLARSSPADLRDAEERYLQKDGTTPVQSGEDLLKQIEDSRFED